MYQRADFLALHDTEQVSRNVHVEDVDGKVVVLAHADGGKVHDLQTTGENFLVADVVELSSRWVFLWVGGIDAVNTRTLEHDVGFYLYAAKGRTCVGGEIG